MWKTPKKYGFPKYFIIDLNLGFSTSNWRVGKLMLLELWWENPPGKFHRTIFMENPS
jgi:hypothetical protein